jgi:membrane-associated phospholipid phosphatase
MKVLSGFLLILALGLLEPGFSQDVQQSPDLNGETSPDAVPPAIKPSSLPSSTAPPERIVSWLRFVPNLAHDQKRIWLFPLSVARGNHLRPTIGFAAITAGLVVAADAPIAKYFQRTKAFNGFNKVFSSDNTSIGMFAIPSAFYAASLIRRDSYAQHTFLLAGEAVLDAEIMTSVVKDIDRRLYPGNVPPNGNFADTWFKQGKGSLIGGRGSFPSGHGIAAFSVATVFAERYSDRRWPRWAAYGLATAVSFSRMSLQSHFASDSFAAGILGYVIARRVVLKSPR